MRRGPHDRAVFGASAYIHVYGQKCLGPKENAISKLVNCFLLAEKLSSCEAPSVAPTCNMLRFVPKQAVAHNPLHNYSKYEWELN